MPRVKVVPRCSCGPPGNSLLTIQHPKIARVPPPAKWQGRFAPGGGRGLRNHSGELSRKPPRQTGCLVSRYRWISAEILSPPAAHTAPLPAPPQPPHRNNPALQPVWTCLSCNTIRHSSRHAVGPVTECAACHHVSLLTPKALIGAGLCPAAEVLDLKGPAPMPRVRQKGPNRAVSEVAGAGRVVASSLDDRPRGDGIGKERRRVGGILSTPHPRGLGPTDALSPSRFRSYTAGVNKMSGDPPEFHPSSSNSAFATFRSAVSKPSVNQPYTGARRLRASARRP